MQKSQKLQKADVESAFVFGLWKKALMLLRVQVD